MRATRAEQKKFITMGYFGGIFAIAWVIIACFPFTLSLPSAVYELNYVWVSTSFAWALAWILVLWVGGRRIVWGTARRLAEWGEKKDKEREDCR